ncbi:MAG TPA: phytoene/squalene synthase family protein [Steroidobacteraceae bacterium]|nr:phytoene/squalene synthase family protein [Steroidobacteraceae bacterium]
MTMARKNKPTNPGHSDEAYQDQILPSVSRTFALTIPQLPPDLSRSVTNAYLLCRVADTIEDEPQIAPPDTLLYMERFSDAVAGVDDAQLLGTELAEKLSQWTLPAERELIINLPRVIRVTRLLPLRQQTAIRRCVDTMCHGMHQFQRTASVRGLDTVQDLDSYCYYVAGVVGEMLTELFCSYSADIEQHRAQLAHLAPSFAQGLQMTNILKDVWEDRSRGACWLPQDVFSRHGVDLSHLSAETGGSGFAAGMHELVGLAHAHLRNALEFTLLIPAREVGIRRFCLWAIGLAVLTLKRIAANPGFTRGAQVKVSRRTVAVTLALSNVATRHNKLLRFLFNRAAAGLPLARLEPDWQPRKLQMRSSEGAEHAASAYHRTRRVNVRDAAADVGLLRHPDRGTAQ